MDQEMLSLMSSFPDKILEIKEMKEKKIQISELMLKIQIMMNEQRIQISGLMLRIQMMAPCLS
jgi:hypothetical protein